MFTVYIVIHTANNFSHCTQHALTDNLLSRNMHFTPLHVSRLTLVYLLQLPSTDMSTAT